MSPDIGPVPAISVPPSPRQTTTWTLPQRAIAGAGRLARAWLAYLRQRVGHRRPQSASGGQAPD